MFKMKCDKKGFTMVELLATIVILGLISAIAIPSVMRLINSSKGKSLESNKNTLVMATESYMQSNTSKLPKNIGEEVILKVSDLKNSNFLKEDIKNADNKSCMKDSFVRIHKYAKDKYSYTAYIYCAGDKVPDKIEANKPKIRVVFTDGQNRITTVAQQNVKTAMVNLTYDGNRDDAGNKFGILGYSYIISVQYSDEEEFVEIYNSGSLDAMGKRKFEIKKDITPYIDITKVTNIRVIAEAYNNDGGYIKVTEDSAYQDVTGPVCGKTKGEPGVNEWNKAWRSKIITIACDDKEGSGCVKDSYTKTFTKESEYGVITIEDNAGNTTDCKVRTHLDWTAPTLTITAKKRNADGSCGTNVGSAKATNSSKNVTFSKYTGGFGSDSWLNLANFPYGVCYEVITEDNVKIGKGTWSENPENLPKSNGSVNNLTQKSSKEFTKSDNKTNFNLITEGYRKGKYVLKDQALNEVVINVIAPIDRTVPTVPNVGLYKKKSGADVTSSSGLSGYTNNTWLSGHVLSLPSGSTDRISQLDHYEYTTSGATATATNQAGAYRNINAEGTSSIKYRACDKAGNCSAYGSQYTIKLDRTKPVCSNVAKLNNASGANYGSGTWTNQSVYTASNCSDTISGCKGAKKVSTTGATGSVNRQEVVDKLVTQSGTSTTQWFVYDNAGNEGACPVVTEKVDKNPPKCTNSGGGSSWTKNNVTINGNCQDPSGGSGCKNNATKTYTTTGAWTGQSPGTVCDNANNCTTCPSDRTIKIDKTGPSCSNSGGSSSWTTSNVTIKGTCSDGHSGCSTGSVSRTFSSEGSWTGQSPGTVCDNVGNCTSCPSDRTIRIDRSSPSCSLGTGGYSNYAYANSTVTVRAYCSDSGSGCNTSRTKLHYVFTHETSNGYNSEQNLTTNSKSASGSPTPGGISSWQYTVYDNAGHSATCNRFSIRFDTAAPHCRYAKVDSSNCTTGSLGPRVKITCTDPGSAPWSVNPSGIYRIKNTRTFTAKDAAGNSTSIQVRAYSYTAGGKKYYCFS